MTELPFAVAPNAGLLASTYQANGLAGFPLQNGTPTILTWTAPADGQYHRVWLIGGIHVTSAETGGQVTLTIPHPDGSSAAPVVFGAGQGTGSAGGAFNGSIVGPGQTVTLAQSSALTAGAAVVWAELWGS